MLLAPHLTQTLHRAVYGPRLMRRTVSHQHPLNFFGMHRLKSIEYIASYSQ